MKIVPCFLILSAACGEVTTNGNDNPPPIIEEVSPGRGGVRGGHTITITGSGFAENDAGENHVVVGIMAAADVEAADDVTLTFTLPAGPGPDALEDLVVFNDNGFAYRADAIRYNPLPVITGVTPDHSNDEGGDTVTITGSGFEDLDAGDPTVTIGSTTLEGVEVVSDTEITADIPAMPDDAGPFVRLDVTVSNLNGDAVDHEAFRYTRQGLMVAGNTTGVFGGGTSNQTLFFVDMESDPVRLVPITPLVSFINAMAIGEDGKVYVVSGRCRDPQLLGVLDPFTGAQTTIGRVTTALDQQVYLQSLAFVGETLYGHSNHNGFGRLVSIDLETAVVTPIGDTPDGTSSGNGIATRNGTSVWLINRSNTPLRSQAVATSVTTDITPMGGAGRAFTALLEYDDELLGITRDDEVTGQSRNSTMVRINRSNGNVTPVSPLGRWVTGFAPTPDTF